MLVKIPCIHSKILCWRTKSTTKIREEHKSPIQSKIQYRKTKISQRVHHRKKKKKVPELSFWKRRHFDDYEGQEVSICASVGSVVVDGFCVLHHNRRLHRWLGRFAELTWHLECHHLHPFGLSLPLLFLCLRSHWPWSCPFLLCPWCWGPWILQRCKLFQLFWIPIWLKWPICQLGFSLNGFSLLGLWRWIWLVFGMFKVCAFSLLFWKVNCAVMCVAKGAATVVRLDFVWICS